MNLRLRLFALAAAALLGSIGASCIAAGGLEVSPLASPAAAKGSDNPSLATGPDGTIWLSWLEATAESETTLKLATFDPGSGRWSEARTVFRQSNWVANIFDAPQVAAQSAERATAVWSAGLSDKDGNVGSPRAYVSETADGGLTWSSPKLLSSESESVEYVSLVPVAGGGLLAAWIDARGRKTEATAPQLYSRLIGGTGPDTVVDPSVCDCCRNSVAPLPDGGALLAYRGRTAGQVRDIVIARFNQGSWDPSRASTDDCWKIEGCPVNGPRVYSRGPSVSLVWVTGAGDRLRVLTKESADAGRHFGPTQQVDLGNPGGRVDTLITPDGTQVVTWLESTGAETKVAAGLYLRTYLKSRPLIEPTLVTPLLNDPVGRVFPRVALVGGGRGTPSRLLFAYTRPGDSPRVETLLVSLPSALSASAAWRTDGSLALR